MTKDLATSQELDEFVSRGLRKYLIEHTTQRLIYR